MRRLSTLIILGTLAGSTAAFAQDWQLAARSSIDDVYIDASTVRRTGQRVRFWAEYRHRTVQTLSDGTSYDTSRSLIEADCQDMSFTALQNSGSLQGRNVIGAYRPTAGMSYAQPGSVIARQIEYACRL